jgi:hypothetical protein
VKNYSNSFAIRCRAAIILSLCNAALSNIDIKLHETFSYFLSFVFFCLFTCFRGKIQLELLLRVARDGHGCILFEKIVGFLFLRVIFEI